MNTELDLTRYKALSFDCYGTLIDWETGIAAVLAPWAREQGLELSDEELLLAYGGNEGAVQGRRRRRSIRTSSPRRSAARARRSASR